jgi:tetratricopeptide (TPR) repeat protein
MKNKKKIFFLFFMMCFSSSVFAVKWSEYSLNRRAKKAFVSEKFADASSYTEQLIQQDPNNGRYFHNLGQSAVKLEKYDEAIKTFNKATTLLADKERVEAMNGLGAALLMNQQPNEALPIYREILKKDPSNALAKHNLELALRMLKQQKQEQKQESDQQKQKQDQQKMKEQLDKKEKEKEPEQQRQQAEEKRKQDEKKESAGDILDRLLHNEEDVRRKYNKRPPKDRELDHDW